jgi:hypothetical protein
VAKISREGDTVPHDIARLASIVDDSNLFIGDARSGMLEGINSDCNTPSDPN